MKNGTLLSNTIQNQRNDRQCMDITPKTRNILHKLVLIVNLQVEDVPFNFGITIENKVE